MINTDWFRLRMEIQKISQRKLAERIGIDHGALSLTLRGKRKMQMHEANAIAKELQVPTTEVIRAAGIEEFEGVMTVPVIGYIETDSTVTFTNKIGDVAAPPDLPPRSYALQFKAGATDGIFPDALAFYCEPNGVNPEAVNRLSIIKDRAGQVNCAFLRRGMQTGTYATSAGRVDLEYATPILWIKT